MSPEMVSIRHDHLDDLAATAQELGTASIVRAMERLGSALVEMRFAPDPRIMFEIALVQLTRYGGADDQSALLARLERLERTVAEGGSPQPKEPPRSSSTGKAIIGGRARRPDPSGSIPRPAAETVTPDSPASTPEPAPPVAPEQDDPQPSTAAPPAAAEVREQSPPASTSSEHDAHSVAAMWSESVRSSLTGMTRALFAPASVGEVSSSANGLSVELLLPSQVHAQKCEAHRDAVQQQLAQSLGVVVELSLNVEGSTVVTQSPSTTEIVEEPIDPNDIVDAPTTLQRSPEEEIADIFPGTRLITTTDD